MNNNEFDLALFTLENAINIYLKDYKIEAQIEIIFLGSQSILFYNHDLNENNVILASNEIDVQILIEKVFQEKILKISNNLDFVYGYGSDFHDENGFYIDNMTSTGDELKDLKNFPQKWRDRTYQRFSESNKIKFVCLDIHDVCAMKLVAHRDKDLIYVQTLIQGGIINKKDLKKSLNEISDLNIELKNKILKKTNVFFNMKQKNIHEKQKKLIPK